MPSTPQSTANAPTCTPNAAAGTSITQSGTTWGNVTPVELIASTGSAISVYGFAFVGTSAQGELDVMTGTAGNEVVKGTAAFCSASGGYSWSIVQFPIPIEIPASTRVAMRTRKSGTTTAAWLVKLLYYPSIDSNCGTCTDGTAVAPAAADAVAFTSSATAWADNTPAELSASLSDIVVLGVTLDGPNNNNSNHELDVCIGAASSETPIGTITWMQGNGAGGIRHFIGFGKPIYVPGTNRFSYRARHDTNVARVYHAKLQYIPFSKVSALPQPFQATSAVHGAEPDAAALPTQASNNSAAWAQSNWKELVASTATAQVLTGITVDFPGITLNDEYEVDIGVGAASSEAVIATIADVEYTLAGLINTRRLLVPVDAIPASSRVAVRFRKKGTTARTVGFGYEYCKKPL